MARWNERILRRAVSAAALVLLSLGSSAVIAQVEAQILPGDPHLVVFPYDENNSYRILLRPNGVTHIVLEPDERLKVLALGDTVSFQSQKKDNHIFIKPVYPGRSTSGTLITNKRSYQLMLQATSETGRWYQRVSFQYPELLVQQETDADRSRLEVELGAASGGKAGGESLEAAGAAAERRNGQGEAAVDPANLNFKYRLDGDASFKPLNVYDDGQATYIKLPDREDIPALFRIKKGGEAELVEYTLRPGNVLVTPRVLDAGLLKLGKEEVKFYNLTRVSRTWFGRVELGD